MPREPDETLVVTSAVRTTDRYLVVKDHDTRLAQLVCGLLCWITRSRVRSIVLCDNTMPDAPFAALRSLAARHGKRLEVLLFAGDRDRVARYGKGYGEGEILRHVLEHSALVREARAFYKITGRVFVENFDEVAAAAAGRTTVFDLRTAAWKRACWRVVARTPAAARLRARGVGHLRTVFYKCGVDYYRRHLLDCHTMLDDRAGRTFESQMFWPVVRHGFDVFPVPPRLTGQCAGTGKPYGDGAYPAEVVEQADAMIHGGERRVEAAGLR